MKHLIILFLVLMVALPQGQAWSDQEGASDSRTVIGPRNPDLKDGADALLAGEVEEGIRLTKLGLEAALGRRERHAALSNLCAGYVMLAQYDTALGYCNEVLSENENNWRALCNRALIYVRTERYDEARADLDRGQEIAPGASHLKEVRGMLLDATDPVMPNIIVDDRRDAGDG